MFALATVMSYIANLEHRHDEDKGATAVEYGMLVALIAAVIVGAVILLGGHINTAFNKINTSLTGAGA